MVWWGKNVTERAKMIMTMSAVRTEMCVDVMVYGGLDSVLSQNSVYLNPNRKNQCHTESSSSSAHCALL